MATLAEPGTSAPTTVPPRRGQLRVAPPAPPSAPAAGGPGHPAALSARVARPALVRRLARADAPPLALLVAPAGYGKTTVLAEWAEQDPRPFAWVHAAEGDAHAEQLLAAIVRRLDAVEPLPAELVRWGTAPHPAGPATDMMALLVESLAAPRRPVVLVVDDAQHLRGRPCGRLLAAVADHLGAGSTLAIASRAEPPLPVGRLRAAGAVVELRAGDLAMDAGEPRQLLRRAGLDLDEAQAATLAQRTEGWPAGLRLAALGLRDADDRDAAVARFAGDDRLVADYLRDELLAPLTAPELALLVRTSPLERLSGGLCDAVLDRRDSGELLRRLSRSGALLAPLDRGEEHFRVHGMLRTLLLAELRRADPEGDAEVHRRAGAWCVRAGDTDGAIDHAIGAGDIDRATDLLWSVAAVRLAQGRLALVESWLTRLGDAAVAARPELALSAAAARATRGHRDAAGFALAAAEQALAGLPDARRLPLASAAAALRAIIARDGIAAMGADAEQAYASATVDSPWRSVSCFLAGVAQHLAGDVDLARARLEEGARRGTAAPPNLRVLCLAQLALIALQEDDPDEGVPLAEQARDEAVRGGLDALPACALVFAVSALARAHDGQVDAARDDLTTARRLLAGLAEQTPWHDAEIHLVLARAELRLSDSHAARRLLGSAARALRHMPDNPTLRAWIDDAWGRVDTFAVGAIGPSTLTTAELRVLRFLPSHLSFREIAARLHVSANTVKTQAHAVYRKLGASSRSQAVARAREVGLVDG